MDFSNTKVAFYNKSNSELRMAKILFQTIQNPNLVKVGKKLLQFALALRLPILWIIRLTVFKHFCGGRTIRDCQKQIDLLHQSGIGTILDFSVESSDTTEDYERNKKEIIETIKFGASQPGIPFAVFKVTAIASNKVLEKVGSGTALSERESRNFERARDRVDEICKAAVEHKVPVLIDAEESWLQHAIDMLAEMMMERYNQDRAWIYTTIQLYRNDKLGYLEELVIRAKSAGYKVGLKLVRGAYMEKEHDRAEDKGYNSPVFREKLSSDQSFNVGVAFCLDNLDHVAFVSGTHNEDSCKILADEIVKRGLAKNDPRIYFSQLLGMSDHISYNLSKEGFNVAKYVPYGPVREVMPYLIRRAEENTSVAGQTSRELQLISMELKRRNSATAS
ncbi:proline dehydrogenase family protein [Luteibaculum oceani]|uniref:Proline dehydrogenase n=1 Tax=Luteibaculum oceani TaxID=1294296 RepID=A0A5C6UY00_9FLAO|nr:proline dehydrogenase family protein [Luteibaculum oceani]TXC78373.1 proline dehydrogenase [Luteibaculum oceani]